MLRGISHPGALSPHTVTPTTEEIHTSTVYQAVVEPPFDVLIGPKQIDWAGGVWRINCKSLIYWWAVQGSNLRPPD